jgi:uncharacterized oxidoreductase
MDITNTTIFIAGGTSGLGLALARSLRAAGSTVVVGGRRTELLEELAAEGFGTVRVDVADPDSITTARDEVLAAYPDLSALLTMSGIMEPEDLRDPAFLEVAERTVTTNLLGTIRLVAAFTPHLVGRGAGTIVTVSSGIAFVPFPLTPTYGATKAGVHSYSVSLREQLRGTGVEVAELAPPAVRTTLMGMQDAEWAMPLDEFVTEATGLLAQQPTPDEVLVERVHLQRSAERTGAYAERLAQNAAALSSLPGRS